MAYSGKFVPTNPKKYRGDLRNIVYRSSWELGVFKMLDVSTKVKWWTSEHLIIPYLSPIDNKPHRYFVDVVFETELGIVAVEIKPDKETRPPKKGANKETYFRKVQTYLVNQSKWKAANMLCESKGWKFKIWTEKHLRKMGVKIL